MLLWALNTFSFLMKIISFQGDSWKIQVKSSTDCRPCGWRGWEVCGLVSFLPQLHQLLVIYVMLPVSVSSHEAMGNKRFLKGKSGIQRPSRSFHGGSFIWSLPIMPGYSTVWYLFHVFANPKLSLKAVWKFAMKQYYRYGSLSFNGCIYFFFIIFKIIFMWPFLESLIGFITISLLFYVLGVLTGSM